jgi:GNAT superfamily N-acetyltransferase
MGKIEYSRRPWHLWDDEMQELLLGLTLVIENPWVGGCSGMQVYTDRHGKKCDTWVALDDGEPIGWGLRVHTGEGAGWCSMQPKKGEVMVYVHPSRRREGIGGALLREIENGKGAGIVWGWDDASMEFYQSAVPRDWEIWIEDDDGAVTKSSSLTDSDR